MFELGRMRVMIRVNQWKKKNDINHGKHDGYPMYLFTPKAPVQVLPIGVFNLRLLGKHVA